MFDRNIIIIDRIDVECALEDTLSVLWDIKNLCLYEPKVDKAYVKEENLKSGTYSANGHFGGISWHGKFYYELRKNGIYSEIINTPIPGLRVQGGFIAEQKNPGICRIIHYENYELPPWLVFLKPVISLYLKEATNMELLDLKKLIIEKSEILPEGNTENVTENIMAQLSKTNETGKIIKTFGLINGPEQN